MFVAFANVPTVINAMDYYSYGKILREYDNGQGDRYLTTQHERDQKTGLDYRGARYYDCDIARFLSLDPLASKYPSWSTYNYVMGNPVFFIDPSGKGVEYTKEIALAKAQRGEDNGYKTEVVENPDKPGDYGVNYTRVVNGKKYEGVQYEGKFEGIVKGGLKKYEGGAAKVGTTQRASNSQSNTSRANFTRQDYHYSPTTGASLYTEFGIHNIDGSGVQWEATAYDNGGEDPDLEGGFKTVYTSNNIGTSLVRFGGSAGLDLQLSKSYSNEDYYKQTEISFGTGYFSITGYVKSNGESGIKLGFGLSLKSILPVNINTFNVRESQ